MGKGELITNSLIYRELTISYQVSYFYRRFNYSEFRDVWFIQQPARLRGFTNPLRKWLMSLMLLNLSIAFQTSILAVVVTCAGESEEWSCIPTKKASQGDAANRHRWYYLFQYCTIFSESIT